jgi:hypothetical protein
MRAMKEITPVEDRRAIYVAVAIAVACIVLILACGSFADLVGIGAPAEEAAEPATAEP